MPSSIKHRYMYCIADEYIYAYVLLYYHSMVAV